MDMERCYRSWSHGKPGASLMLLLLSTLVTCVMTQWPHHVYREDWKERTCSTILRQVKHRRVIVDMPLRLTGHWTSHRCEIRSGPQFVLRSYVFHGLRFESVLYHYEDPDCSRPLYAVVATGIHRLLQESWVIPGVLEASYRLVNAYLVTYNQRTADDLSGQLGNHCSRGVSTNHSSFVLSSSSASFSLRPFQKFPILSLPRTPTQKNGQEVSSPSSQHHHHQQQQQPQQHSAEEEEEEEEEEEAEEVIDMEDFDCTAPLNFTLNELQLVRLETRVHFRGSTNEMLDDSGASRGGIGSKSDYAGFGPQGRRVVRELLLGDVHTDPTQRQSHRPTSFQEPLRDAEMSLCGVCSRVRNSDALNPPRLGIHQGTLLSLEGEWVSTRCESRQYGQFLTRWLHFLPDGHSWEGRYDYYHDALCRLPAFTLRAKGSYAGGQESQVIRGSKAYSFKTTRLKITARDALTVKNLNGYQGRQCGAAGQWERDKEQDVTHTAGCITLGIRLPNLEQDLLRMEVVHRKLLLYVGQRTSDHPVTNHHHHPHHHHNHHPPPSAFQAPLIKCDARDLDMSINSFPEGKTHALAMASLNEVEEDGENGLEASSASSGTPPGPPFTPLWLLWLSVVVMVRLFVGLSKPTE